MKIKEREEVCHKYLRVRTDEAVNKFCDDLLKEQWEGVHVGEVNAACDSFLKTYLTLYDKHCPIRQLKNKTKQNIIIMTSHGFQRACEMRAKRKTNFTETLSNSEQKMLSGNVSFLRIS